MRFNGPKKAISTNPATFYWSGCTKSGKWVVMYLC